MGEWQEGNQEEREPDLTIVEKLDSMASSLSESGFLEGKWTEEEIQWDQVTALEYFEQNYAKEMEKEWMKVCV